MKESDGSESTGPILSAPNINSLWAALLVEELVRQGVGLFVLAPGSRSAPLALAVAGNPRARYIVHVDERGCGFVALGHARATGRPAAVVTTSGTAVANLLPAAVEADHDGVPLLLLTADRPPELRETGANQAIRQAGLFAGTARWHFDFPTPSTGIDPAFVLTTAAQAVHRSLTPRGPVHLNMMFREPLGPSPDGLDAVDATRGLQDWIRAPWPYTVYRAADHYRPGELERFAGIERGVVVVGKTDDPALGPAAAALGAALGWPVLPDVGSGLRLGGRAGPVIPFFDAALSSQRLSAGLPEAVIHLGGPVVSKRLSTLIASARPRQMIVVRDDPSRYDPAHHVTERVQGDAAAWAASMAAGRPAVQSQWLDTWLAASDAAGTALHEALGEELSEPQVARVAAASVPEGGAMVLGSSMPIRDVDSFARREVRTVRVAANRGASGIDGTVSTAAGFALGAGTPTVLLAGDLALLHDLNALALLRRDGMPSVVIVVVNNDGGGIFSFLPIADEAGVPFEDLFGTPHGLSFEHAARMHDLSYDRPRTARELANAIAGAFERHQPMMLEVRTDRSSNRALHADLLKRVSEAVDRALEGRL